MSDRFKSLTLVTLQFLFIILLFGGSRLKEISVFDGAFIIIAILLILWATISMQRSKIRILPEPAANATLISHGPYRFVRHPMYLAILLGCTGLLINHFTLLRLFYLILLATVLIIKLNWEEKMLSGKFEKYKEYKKHTSRLIPPFY